MKKIFFALVLSILSLGAFAQKVGHVNTGILLEGMSEVKAADAQLVTLQKELVTKGDEMVKSFQAEYNAVLTDVNAGNLNPKEQQDIQLELQKKQQEIQAYQQKVQTDLMTEREKLLKPILEKVDKAIQEVGKENSFLFIFDTAIQNAVLFADDPLDVTDKVKAKLGI